MKVNKSKEIKYIGQAACMGEVRNAYGILAEKLKDVNNGRSRQRLEDNLKKGVKKIRLRKFELN
jgi:hypothetical protein